LDSAFSLDSLGLFKPVFELLKGDSQLNSLRKLIPEAKKLYNLLKPLFNIVSFTG
jgi:hypothetical protein